MDDTSRQAFEEFVTFCDDILKKTGWTRKVLADKLHLDPSYFARLYHKRTPNMPNSVLVQARNLAHSVLAENISPSPEKIKIAEGLPVDIGSIREEITRLKAIQDQDRKDKNEMRERVAVLESIVERAKLEGEKKIYELEAKFAAALKYELERITGRLAGGPREANG